MISSFNQIAAGARGDGASSDFDNQGRSCVLVGIVFRSDKGEQGRTRKNKEGQGRTRKDKEGQGRTKKNKEEQRSTHNTNTASGDREVEASPHFRERINSIHY